MINLNNKRMIRKLKSKCINLKWINKNKKILQNNIKNSFQNQLK